MSRGRSSWLVAVVIAVLAPLGGVGASAAASPPKSDASAVIHWNPIATTTLVQLPGPASGAPPALQINLGMVQGAVYDAVNAITPKHHRPYLLEEAFLRQRLGGSGCRSRGVSRSSPHRLDRAREHRIPEQGNLAADARHAIRGSLAAVPDNSFKTAGDRRR